MTQPYVMFSTYILLTGFIVSNFYAASGITEPKRRRNALNIAGLLVLATFIYSYFAR